MVCFLLVLLHVLDCIVLCPPTEGEGHVVFAAVPMRVSVTLNVFCLFDLGLTSLSTFFSHIATVSGCGRELNAHF